jgi:GH15 family glucan-1,4-alpha-glucosidase
MRAIAATEAWWRQWCGRCSHQGPWRDAVVRSQVTPKALSYEPTGGIVPAATTSSS